MDRFTKYLVAAVAATGVAAQDEFNVLQHLGGNAQWLPGPEVTGISSDVPAGCNIDMAASFSRHGSRYPDRGAFAEWVDLESRLRAANFTVADEKLEFLSTWKPVLEYPAQQIAQLSTTGYKELYDMGATYRLRYPELYEYNTNFTLWANYYTSGPRVRDSARLFARGFLGPNATELGTIYALNASDPQSFMNSLATSDGCPAYDDDGGSPQKDVWDNIYLPPIRSRLNNLIQGNFNFTQWDVSIIPYLCGFETQITGSRSPFCDLYTEEEILQYEYAQDLRYWYGNGLGTEIEKFLMVPVVDGLLNRFVDGPNATYTNSDGTAFVPPKLIVSFANDGQINQLIAATGVFDNEPHLPSNQTLENRLFRASRLVPMRGTVAFERLSCAAEGYGNGTSTYVRVRFNDVVYPIADCESGPGSSCPLGQYKSIIEGKLETAGNYGELCNVTNPDVPGDRNSVTFFTDVTESYISVVKP
ncbi:acid phosphatase PHO12 precursor [Corynespora cassiicola Philippines]|uniref:Acid phosphatase PHO12 n=1 Tax=Corynespora cassiicola Philippines TaxID=1448308 RepID=A0A2T2PAX6_CORCC|nr:acid phosphatase PHO12 precursor [Corynespora cassiicola Philippines]